MLLRVSAITAVLLGAAGATVAAGCASADRGSQGAERVATATTRTAPARAASNGAVLSTAGSRYGRILVDGRGHALYLFTYDRVRGSRCFGDCARAWPPYYTRAAPRARGHARASLAGSIRRGKRRQVTYDGHPVYFYVGDRAPGLILCQAVTEFGGEWFVVAPSGAAITKP